MYIPHGICPLICWWTLRLLPPFCHSEKCFGYAPRSRIAASFGIFYFNIFEELPCRFFHSAWLHYFTISLTLQEWAFENINQITLLSYWNLPIFLRMGTSVLPKTYKALCALPPGYLTAHIALHCPSLENSVSLRTHQALSQLRVFHGSSFHFGMWSAQIFT